MMLKKKLADIEQRIEEICDYQIDPDYVDQKLIDLKDRSRRINLRVESRWYSRNSRGDMGRLWRDIATTAPGETCLRMPNWNGTSTSSVKQANKYEQW